MLSELRCLSEEELNKIKANDVYAITEIIRIFGVPTPPIIVRFFGKFDRNKSDLAEKLKEVDLDLKLYALPMPTSCEDIELDSLNPEKLLELILADQTLGNYFHHRDFAYAGPLQFFNLCWKNSDLTAIFDLHNFILDIKYKDRPEPSQIKELKEKLKGKGVTIKINSYEEIGA